MGFQGHNVAFFICKRDYYFIKALFILSWLRLFNYSLCCRLNFPSATASCIAFICHVYGAQCSRFSTSSCCITDMILRVAFRVSPAPALMRTVLRPTCIKRLVSASPLLDSCRIRSISCVAEPVLSARNANACMTRGLLQAAAPRQRLFLGTDLMSSFSSTTRAFQVPRNAGTNGTSGSRHRSAGGGSSGAGAGQESELREPGLRACRDSVVWRIAPNVLYSWKIMRLLPSRLAMPLAPFQRCMTATCVSLCTPPL